MEADSTHTQILSREKYECKICDNKFTSADELRQHLMAHIGKVKTGRDHSAARRSPRLPSSEPADRGAHLPVPNRTLAFFKCTVEGCQYTTNKRDHFSQHLGSHCETNDSRCVYCFESFSGTATLVQHMMTSHLQRFFQCGLCTYSATQPMHIILHFRWYHEESELSVLTRENVGPRTSELTPRPRDQAARRSLVPYCCSGCGFKVIDPDTFRLHLTNHANLKQFDCFICHVSANSPKALVEHLLQHGLGAVMCGLCRHCELNSLKSMLKHHCDKHPDGSLQIVFRKRQQAAKFEQFIAEFGQMSRYLLQPPSVQEDSPHADTNTQALSCAQSTTRKQYLPPLDTYRENQARDRSPH